MCWYNSIQSRALRFPLERPKSMSTDGLMKSVDSNVGVKWEIEGNYKKMRIFKNKG